MREIEFRGKDYDGKWKYGSLMSYEHFGTTMYEIITCPPPDFDSCRVKEETIGQFTGYLDSMNVRVFEGDIVRVAIDSSDRVGRFSTCSDLKDSYRGVVAWNKYQCKYEVLLEENAQFDGKHHILSVEIGWGYEAFLVVGKYIDDPFPLERDRKASNREP